MNEVDDDKVNILLVDDQPAKLLSYEVILGELGETLIKADSARDALGLLLKHDVAVILIDVCMPELDGFELAEMIREHPRFQKTAIIFVSAVLMTEPDRLRGYDAGAVDYVSVPVVPQVLRAKVRIFAELYRKTRQLEKLNADLEARVDERTAALHASTEELRHLNEQLEERVEERTREREVALAQLFEAQKLDTIGQLTGGIAHDFNNLLQVVLSSMLLLKKMVPAEGREQRLVDNAIQGAHRGAALTQRLLAFARRQELKPEAVDFANLFAGLEDLMKRSLGPRVRITKLFAPELPHVRVDANQLELALLNLAVNARDAMPSGGQLTITATVDSEDGKFVQIVVSDDGMGMDAATLAKATEPFFTTKGVGKGTGLGLSMVHGLAVQSGGSLHVTSAVGGGTHVVLLLPRATARDVRGESEHAGPLSTAASRSRTVLLVDDDPLVASSTLAMLEDLGHVALSAMDGHRAIELLRDNPQVELVITDQLMPEMTGTELARRLCESHPALPVILATGFSDLDPGEADDLTLPRLSKPYGADELGKAIDRSPRPRPSAAPAGASPRR